MHGQSHERQMQYSYSKKMVTGRADPIRIVDGPDNQLPDEWSSTLLSVPRSDNVT